MHRPQRPAGSTHSSTRGLTREGRDLGVAFQAPPGSQASSRGEAKDCALLSSRDAGLLEPPERPQGQPTAQRPQPLPVWPTGLKTLWVLGGVAGSPQVPTKVDTALLSGKWSHHLGPSSDPGRGRAGTGHPACTSIGLWTPGARTPVPAQPRGVLSDHSASPGSQKSQVSPGLCTCRRREPRPPRPPLSKHPDRMSLLIPGEPAATCLQGRLLGSRVRASALTAWKCQRQAWPDPASTLCNSKASWEVTPQEGGSHHGHCARTAPRQGLRRPPVQTPPAFHARGRVVNRCSERGNFLMDQQPSKKKTPSRRGLTPRVSPPA